MPLAQPTNPYAAIADLTLYGAPAGAFAATTPEQQQAAVNAGNALADDYLGRRFKLPLAQWGPDLVRAVAVIATYDLIVVRGSNPDAPGNADLHARWLAAIQWLQGVAEGNISPQLMQGAPTATGGGATGGQGTFVESVSSDDAGRFVVSRPISGRGW